VENNNDDDDDDMAESISKQPRMAMEKEGTDMLMNCNIAKLVPKKDLVLTKTIPHQSTSISF
jgi:hypothetical protein